MTDKGVFWSGCVTTNIGLKRPNNEDNFLLNGEINAEAMSVCKRRAENGDNAGWQCAGVFDGMGGGENGELASYYAASEVQKMMQKTGKYTTEETIETMTRQGFLNANQRIVEERVHRSVLGTTATVICFRRRRAKVFHLRDSRAYLVRDDRLYQITRDQTLATLRIEAGCYDVSSRDAERDSRLLTEYVGADETMTAITPMESEWINMRPSDKILLCSDGLYRMCSEKRIKEILLSGNSPEVMADTLIKEAMTEGGEDNITCVVLTVNDGKLQAGGHRDGN